MFYCGIDPGADGGVAILDQQGKVVEYMVYNNIKFAKMLARYIGEEIKFCIEDVHAVENSKASSTFKFGVNTGRAHGIVTTYLVWTNQDISQFSNVLPTIWKRDMGALLGDNAQYEERKLRSIERAHELFPGINIQYKGQWKRDANGEYVKQEKQISKNKTKLVRVKEYVDHDGLADALLIAEWNRRQHECK